MTCDYLGCLALHYGPCMAEGLRCVPAAEVSQGSVSILHCGSQLLTQTCFTFAHVLASNRADTNMLSKCSVFADGTHEHSLTSSSD